MTDQYPATLEEFWERLQARTIEPDLDAALRERANRTAGRVQRLGRHETVVAFAETVLPGAAVPASVLAAFIDDNFDRQLGRGDEREGLMPRAELIPAGFAALDAAAGGDFGALDTNGRERLLRDAEAGQLPGLERFDSALWFKRTRDLVLLGYGSDPRGMTQMGCPGPSFKPGYTWLGWGGPDARRARRPGFRRL